MIRGFSTKKIKAQKTLGETLKNARLKRNASLFDAEIATKVRVKFLAAIEKGDWNALPQNVYLRGFVLAYAKFLELDTKQMLNLYENERQSTNKAEEKHKISYNQSLHQSKMLITPKTLAYFGLVTFVAGMFTYIIYQVVSFAGNPNLRIVSPENNIVVETDSTDLSGVTDTDTLVVVNNENVPVTNDGHFALKLKLHQGINIIKVQAVNKAKKESSQIFTIEYKPKTASLENNMKQ